MNNDGSCLVNGKEERRRPLEEAVLGYARKVLSGGG